MAPSTEEQVVAIAKRSLSLLLLRVVPPIILGMLSGFLMINHKPVSLQSTFSSVWEGNFIIRTAFLVYFAWFFFVWSIVYIAGLFLLLLRPMVRGILHGIFGIKDSIPAEFFLELIFGLWVCGQITGTWVEGNSPLCFRKGNCQYSVIAESLWDATSFKCKNTEQFLNEGDYGTSLKIGDVEECEWNFFFFPRLLYTIIGTVAATLISSIICDSQCCIINIFLFLL